MSTLDVHLQCQTRLDSKWLKTDLQQAFQHGPGGLSQLWNQMIQDGELTGTFSDGLFNSAGVTARKGTKNTKFRGCTKFKV